MSLSVLVEVEAEGAERISVVRWFDNPHAKEYLSVRAKAPENFPFPEVSKWFKDMFPSRKWIASPDEDKDGSSETVVISAGLVVPACFLISPRSLEGELFDVTEAAC